MNGLIFPLFGLLTSATPAAPAPVRVDLEPTCLRDVGGVTEFDRAQFITIHASLRSGSLWPLPIPDQGRRQPSRDPNERCHRRPLPDTRFHDRSPVRNTLTPPLLLVWYVIYHKAYAFSGERNMSDTSLNGKVYDELYRRLIDKDLQPGDLIDRRALAEELGVSLSPVVHAMTRLQHEGFLEILPRKISRVKVVREEDFRAQMLIRNALECQAARIYCGEAVRCKSAELTALARHVDSTREARLINWPAEIAFHGALVALIESPGFDSEFARVMRLGHFVLVSTFSEINPFPVDPSRTWHEGLVRGLQTDDPDAAEAVIREHLQVGRERYLKT